MKDLHKIVEGENTQDNQNDSKKEKSKPSMVKKETPVNKKFAEPNETPEAVDLTNIITEASPENVQQAVDDTKVTKPVSKKVAKAEAKIAVVKPPKKQKSETEPMVKNVVLDDSTEEKEKPDSVKVSKKKAKKIEKKVDKLKKKVKKEKKKDVKKSKLKALKEKLEKALNKFKNSSEKLKEEKK
jgi:hypothetical protein